MPAGKKICRLAVDCENFTDKPGFCLIEDKCYEPKKPKKPIKYIISQGFFLSLHEQYHKETGLNSHYSSNIGSPRKNRKGLVYTRKYVWWLEMKIKDQMAIIDNLNQQLTPQDLYDDTNKDHL